MSKQQLHQSVGVAAGSVYEQKRRTPVVTLSFVKDFSALDDLEDGHYDPEDGRWHNFALTVRAARQMIADLEEAIDIAINEGQLPEGADPEKWE
jgi:hypothetical protein